MELSQINSAIALWLSVCGFVVTTGGLVAAISKLWQWVKRDTREATTHLETVDDWLASDKKRIESLERRQDDFERQNRLQLKALMQLMTHEIDGDHVERLAEVRDEINTYLIER